MLIDDWLDFRKGLSEGPDPVYEYVEAAQVFVLSPQVVLAAKELARSPNVLTKNRQFLVTPASVCWIEWAGGETGYPNSNRHGLLLAGDNFRGCASYVGDYTARRRQQVFFPLDFDLKSRGAIFKNMFEIDNGDPEIDRLLRRQPQLHELSKKISLERLETFLSCVLCLLNSPRVTTKIIRDQSRINRQRQRKGFQPLLSYTDVLINPISGWVSKQELRGFSDSRRRHHVRSCLRPKKGKIEIVKSYWRGDREKGYVLHRYVVGNEDFQSSLDALPATQRMPPGFVAPGDSR